MNSVCVSLRPVIFATLEDEIGPESRIKVTSHLATCSACRRLLLVERGLTRDLVIPQRQRRRLPILAMGTAAAVVLLVVFFQFSETPPVHGSIAPRSLDATLQWQNEGGRKLRATNHIDIPLGSDATINVEGTGKIYCIGPVTFELDKIVDTWKLTLLRGQVRVNVLEGSELVVASNFGLRRLPRGDHILALAASYFQGGAHEAAMGAKKSPCVLMAEGIRVFNSKDENRDAIAEGMFETVSGLPGVSKSQRSRALFFHWITQGNQKKYVSAIQSIDSWLLENPEAIRMRATALFNKGMYLWWLGKRGDANRCWDEVLKSDSDRYKTSIESFRRQGSKNRRAGK